MKLSPQSGPPGLAEVVGFDRFGCRAISYQAFGGWGLGSFVFTGLPTTSGQLAVHPTWLGRVIDSFGRPLDGRGALASGEEYLPIYREPPSATSRATLGERIDLGVVALNLFTTCRHGQRLGVFAGSGVGKSTLVSMLANNAEFDVTIVALIGERGKEVRDFIESKLTQVSLEKTIIVVATSDSSPSIKTSATLSAVTISEYFRDRGSKVLLILDSITRYCNSLREIALSVGEAPVSRGYPISVFSNLSKLLERVGPGVGSCSDTGYITGIFTVLVDGDDFNEPVSDTIRGLLDGHIILDRKIAERGRYPAIDIVRSLSRSVTGCNSASEDSLTRKARQFVALHEEMYELIKLGVYRPGTDALVDRVIQVAPKIEQMLTQGEKSNTNIVEHFKQLRSIIEE
ncbi:MAG: FliI/YscN family ATPase [Acetobacteraceae bacterium]|nr:FliI/YscN family ATPase [Acetobacteraceae bacterium]